MQRSHKIQLVPNQKAVEYFQQACGVARFTYNWALAESCQQYKEEGGQPSPLELKRYFNSFKRFDYEWMNDVTKCASEQPFVNLNNAFQRYFKKLSNFPKPKKKYKSKDSFYIANDQFSIDGKYINIPKLGKVKMTEKLRYEGTKVGFLERLFQGERINGLYPLMSN